MTQLLEMATAQWFHFKV